MSLVIRMHLRLSFVGIILYSKINALRCPRKEYMCVFVMLATQRMGTRCAVAAAGDIHYFDARRCDPCTHTHTTLAIKTLFPFKSTSRYLLQTQNMYIVCIAHVRGVAAVHMQ